MFKWITERLKQHELRPRKPTCDGLYKVWLWFPTWIYERETSEEYPYSQCYLEPSYKDWWCWACKREGTYIGVIHQSLEEAQRIIEREEKFEKYNKSN